MKYLMIVLGCVLSFVPVAGCGETSHVVVIDEVSLPDEIMPAVGVSARIAEDGSVLDCVALGVGAERPGLYHVVFGESETTVEPIRGPEGWRVVDARLVADSDSYVCLVRRGESYAVGIQKPGGWKELFRSDNERVRLNFASTASGRVISMELGSLWAPSRELLLVDTETERVLARERVVDGHIVPSDSSAVIIHEPMGRMELLVASDPEQGGEVEIMRRPYSFTRGRHGYAYLDRVGVVEYFFDGTSDSALVIDGDRRSFDSKLRTFRPPVVTGGVLWMWGADGFGVAGVRVSTGEVISTSGLGEKDSRPTRLHTVLLGENRPVIALWYSDQERTRIAAVAAP